jgi:hypothetical protein
MARRGKRSHASQTHWLVVTDPFRKVIESCVLTQDVDVQQALQSAVARWVAEGWEAEGDCSYNFCFIRRTGQRLLINVTATDPTRPPTAGHAFLAGGGSKYK